MGKIEGVSTFSALFTTVNQYSEIRSMNFTPSKKQDDWAPILTAMLPSLTKISAILNQRSSSQITFGLTRPNSYLYFHPSRPM
jgi:hypothetical protein